MDQENRFITGKQFKDMLLGAYHSFEKNYESINDLNVFPVPDGDTGTNMMHTLASVAKELSAMPDNCDAGEVGTVAGRAAIMGARGNSGVILSQLLRGIGKGTAGKKVLTHTEFGKAFQYGVLYAYRSVSTPVEGTILTVARGMAKGTYSKIRGENSFVEILEAAIENGKEYLQRTPDMLPALKAAGVVDAGGQGLIVFLEGCVAGIQGKDCEVLPVEKSLKNSNRPQNLEPLDLEFPYCTEFIVKGAAVDKQTVCDALTGFGNSMIVAVVDDIVKVHIHTKNPGNALNTAQAWGTLHDIKVENMMDQHENRLFDANETPISTVKKGIGVLTVAAGEGIAQIMHEFGASEIISGGQSMNPPVEDFFKAIENGSNEQYIILPNNKNIILAAEQVRKLLGASKVSFIPTTNLAQGLAALLHFDATRSLEDNVAIMTGEAKQANCGAIARAVRDSVVHGIEVLKDQYLGILNDKIVAASNDMMEAIKAVLDGGDYEVISLYYGDDMNEDSIGEVVEQLEEINEDWEVESFYGGQPLYPIIMSME